MATSLDEIIDDLAAEQAALEAVLVPLPADAWDIPTHAPGWAVRDQVSHLANFDEYATRIIAGEDNALAEMTAADPDAPPYLAQGRGMTPAQLLAWWQRASRDLIAAARTLDPTRRLLWGQPMSAASFLTARLMETWSHGLDVVDAVGADRPDTDRLRQIARLGVATRPYSYLVRGMTMPDVPVRVELTLPSGAVWSDGDPAAENRILGTATDFCRVVTQRRHVADTGLEVRGPAAAEWMEVAQAFAGPPGEGRSPGQFAHERTA
jgi:uncharacterized protein (TIGR03084 family)